MPSYIQDGKFLNYTNAVSTTVAGNGVVVLGSRIGVAVADIAYNTVGALMMEGVHQLAKAAGAITAGQVVYWDSAAGKITTESSANTVAGFAVEAAASAATTVKVKINA